MRIRRHMGAAVAGALGSVMIVVHIVLAVVFGLTASQWVSGAALGLVLVMAAALHVTLAARRRDRGDRQPEQPSR